MKLSQIEKRIPQTLTNSKDIIQTDREYGRRSSRATSTRGQENEAWAMYQKIPSPESWGDLLGTYTSFARSHPSLLKKYLANHNSPEQTPHTRLNFNVDILNSASRILQCLNQSARIFCTRAFWLLRHTDEPQRGRNSCLWLQSRSVLSSFGVVLMSCRVNFHVVRSALQYSACRI